MAGQRATAHATRRGEPMQHKAAPLAFVIALAFGFLALMSVPAHAATNQLAGRAYLDPGGECPPPQDPYADYPAIVMTGSLEGCWYTNILATRETPSGVYLETGEEVFVGSLNGEAEGSFTTTYRFESKWDPNVTTGSEVHGRCQHPIAVGSGTGGLEGAKGRVDFKDIIETGDFLYRGHISLT
jgi:hypothetical protein